MSGKGFVTPSQSAAVKMFEEVTLENLPEHFLYKLRCFNLGFFSPSYYSTNQYLSEYLC